ncbi:uroporphyrinogen decarboxylase [Candidatus Pantoea edessiphila]|uniref:Uroporphyrinogen decarboxylase n=1 Tax=Candidatus Pantoea edessiphila TaxID=2044610 RepID=A0A2P5SZ70_9GAMM|nr:uroporphyrinogen decarboxylase [Candidatus Pantoea edessiphila]MBK4775543.1 uroporphyrinogen decarboxylase [Pantoea sp. Edef]PPI87600.1 uroporphyrinogen decarboxylase [Candidatus Pantoea edessiphila]
MYKLKNDRYLRALLRKSVDMTPIWIMRQAGRYLPEYKLIRAKFDNFLSVCKNIDAACEIALQPLRRYDLDAAIIFSDILVIPDAMGLGLYFDDKYGPGFLYPITCQADIERLPICDPEKELSYVMNIIRMTYKNLQGKVPLIGFSGSPWTLATYMVQDSTNKFFNKIKKMMYSDPIILHKMLNKITDNIILYLNAQICAGIQCIMLFDTWGGILTHPAYKEFSLYYLQKIVANLLRTYQGFYIPIILFTKGGNQWLEDMANIGVDALSIDWNINIGDARRRVGDKVAIQGNMDPSVLYSSPDRITQEVKMILDNFGEGNGHIFNLGHGIYRDILPENVSVFINAVHNLSKR